MSDPPVTLEATPQEGGDHDGQAIQGGIVERSSALGVCRVVLVSAAQRQGPHAIVAFAGVLLDWRGTLVVGCTNDLGQ